MEVINLDENKWVHFLYTDYLTFYELGYYTFVQCITVIAPPEIHNKKKIVSSLSFQSRPPGYRFFHAQLN